MLAPLVASLAIELALLSTPPPEAVEPATVEPPQAGSLAIASDYDLALDDVRRGIELVSENSETGREQLQSSLSALSSFGPRLAAEPDALALREHGLLALAQAQQLTGRNDDAHATVDELLRISWSGDRPEVEDPALAELVHERAAKFDARPRRDIVINCGLPCRVYIDEQRVEADDLLQRPTARYRLWVAAADSSLPPLREVLVLAEAEQPLTRHFDALPPVREDYGFVPDPPRPPPEAFKQWAPGESAILAGKVVMGIGGTLLGVGVVCALVAVFNSNIDLNTRIHLLGPCAGTMAVIGAPILLSGGIAYAVGKRRERKAQKTGMLHVVPTHIGADGASVGVLLTF